MKFLNDIKISYHTKMREFYSNDNYFNDQMKVIYHDMKLQRLKN